MNNNIKKLIELSDTHPELPIKCAVDYEVCTNDDRQWWLAKIQDVAISDIYIKDEHVFVDDEIYEELYSEDDKIEYDLRYKELIESKKIIKVILIYISF